MIKTLGAGAALWAMGTLHSAEETAKPKAAPEKKLPPPQPFTLPALPYAYDALAPVIDARTMELHHMKHHQAYIDSANRALASFPPWQKKTAEDLLKEIASVPETLRAAVRNNVGGHVNHSMFWRLLTPGGRHSPGPGLATAIDKTFGSFDSFKLRYVETGMKRFGSGWVWLAVNPVSKLELFSSANQDSPLMNGYKPILGVDVWEHAYYLQYQNRRQDYLEAVCTIVNWNEVDALYAAALGGHPSS
jgi:Fe-Mn family superoxide dismutase